MSTHDDHLDPDKWLWADDAGQEAWFELSETRARALELLKRASALLTIATDPGRTWHERRHQEFADQLETLQKEIAVCLTDCSPG